jgi:hypothetical protein
LNIFWKGVKLQIDVFPSGEIPVSVAVDSLIANIQIEEIIVAENYLIFLIFNCL